ncbi:MAG: iron ABC transporter permease [Bacteroidota bacterium]
MNALNQQFIIYTNQTIKQLNKLKRDLNQWSIWTILLTLFLAVPTLVIFVKLFAGPGETWGHFVEYLLLKYLSNSLYLAITCSLLTIVLGVSTAWWSTRYEFPLRKPLEWLLILPLAIPSYITAYAYAGLLDYGGSLELIGRALSLPSFKINIMNIHGLVFVLSISLYPYVYVACRAFFLHQSQNLIEAAQVLGGSAKRNFFKLILPIARPAIVGGVILVLMEVLNDYGAAKYYGVNTFTTGIFKAWFGYEEIETAVYLAALLLLMIFSLIFLEQWQRRRKKFTSQSKSRKPLKRIVPSKSKQLSLLFLTALPAVLGFLIPVLQLLYWAFLTYESVMRDSFLTIALQSLFVAGVAAVACVLFAFLLLYSSHWNYLKGIKNLSKFGVLGYAIPGAVIAVGIYIPSLQIDRWLMRIFGSHIGLILTGTAIALIYAYVVRFLAVAYNPISAGREKIQSSLSEASHSLGKGTLATFFRIEFPLLRTALFSAMILVFIDVMKELPLTLLLKPYDVQTLAVKAYEYASDERIMETALPSLLIVLMGVLPVVFLNKLVRNDK